MGEESEIEKFRCYDCNVNEFLSIPTNVDLSKERTILKKTTYKQWYGKQIVYECNLGLQNCRKLRSFANSERVATYIEEKTRIRMAPTKARC